MRRALAASSALVALAFAPASRAQEPDAAPTAPPDAPAAPPPPVAATSVETSTPTSAAPVDAPARPWRFTATVGVVSAPRVLSLEALARFRRKEDPRWDLFALGAAVEYLPPGLIAFGEDTKFRWLQVGVEGRWSPWRWVFVGARLGWQSVSCCDAIKYTSRVDYTTTSFVIAPKAGVLHTFDNGLTIGADLAAGIPIAADTTLTSDGQTDSNGRKVAKTFGMFTMPAVSLFRIGYTL